MTCTSLHSVQCFAHCLNLIGDETSEFFQVPDLMQSGRARNFLKFQSIHTDLAPPFLKCIARGSIEKELGIFLSF